MIGNATIHDAAVAYAEAGWSVFPLQPKSKRPVGPWAERQQRAMTVDEVGASWTEAPSANVAVVTGRISKIVVLDADSPDVQPPDGRGWGIGPVALTARGTHRPYSFLDGEIIPTVPGLLPKLDLKAEGSYVVAPPSVHPSGGIYRWEDGLAPWDFDWIFPTLPDWMLDLVVERGRRNGRKPGWIDETLSKLPASEHRNVDLTAVAGKLRRGGFGSGELAISAQSLH